MYVLKKVWQRIEDTVCSTGTDFFLLLENVTIYKSLGSTPTI